jgi:phage tail sheath protein FI
VLVWGARTLAAEASEWRYLNVRRLFNMLKESIAEGTRWIVFEPNDETLWRSIRRDISAFLTRVWRDGALFGASAQEAFFVKCDRETNPPDVRDAGQVVAQIGVAPVKPAEFVVFQLSQSAVGSDTESMGG